MVNEEYLELLDDRINYIVAIVKSYKAIIELARPELANKDIQRMLLKMGHHLRIVAEELTKYK